jgi:hypothetical protein
MPTVQILVRVIQTFATEVPGPIAPGKRFVFSDDLVLERYDDSTPGSGLPQNQNQRLAGTQSGVLTIVRIAAANDRFFPANSRLVQFEGTYKFNTLDDTPLQKGQVTAQGVLLFGSNNNDQLEPPVRFAITGGTGPYNTAHGKITEGVRGTPTAAERLLDIEL